MVINISVVSITCIIRLSGITVTANCGLYPVLPFESCFI